MANSSSKKVKKTFGRAALFGVVSLALYLAVFTNEHFVRETWAKGGIYAVLPIVTVFVFSFIHGEFANNLMSSLGMVPKKH